MGILGLGSKKLVIGHFISLLLMFPLRHLSESGSCLYKAFLSVSSAMFNSRSPRPCQPKQEATATVLSLKHTHTHMLSPAVKSPLPCLSMVRGMVVWSLSSSLSSCSYMKPVSHTVTIMFWEGQGSAVEMLCKQKHLF